MYKVTSKRITPIFSSVSHEIFKKSDEEINQLSEAKKKYKKLVGPGYRPKRLAISS